MKAAQTNNGWVLHCLTPSSFLSSWSSVFFRKSFVPLEDASASSSCGCQSHHHHPPTKCKCYISSQALSPPFCVSGNSATKERMAINHQRQSYITVLNTPGWLNGSGGSKLAMLIVPLQGPWHILTGHKSLVLPRDQLCQVQCVYFTMV